MEFLRQTISKINTQMSDLTASQRLAIGLCVVVIVGSFLWLGQWAVKPEYVRLLDQPMSADELVAVRQALPAGKVKIVGEHAWVPASERYELFWKLQEAGALPSDTTVTFRKLIEDESPFRPESENRFRRRVALQNELAIVLASSEAIKSAEVFIQDNSDRRINGPNLEPTASIHVVSAAGRSVDREMVKACAAIVAGAVKGLSVHRVSVIDGTTLREFKVSDPSDVFADGLWAETKKQEDHLLAKLERQLSYITGVRVTVSVELDSAREQSRSLEYTQPDVAEEKTSVTDTRSGSPSGETGVGPNVGQSLNQRGVSDTSLAEESSTKYQDQQLAKETTRLKAPFGVLRATASIGIPRSYIELVVAVSSGGTGTVDQAQLKEGFDRAARTIREVTKTVLMTSRDQDVTVEMFEDVQASYSIGPDGVPVSATGAVAATDPAELLKQYGPEGALGLLATAALFLTWRMARNSSRDAERLRRAALNAAGSAEVESDELLTVPAASVGSAIPTETASLQAQEVNPAELRAGELTKQVVELIDTNPADVAKMIRRWTDSREG